MLCRRIKTLAALLFFMALLALTLGDLPIIAQSSNEVHVAFITSITHFVPRDKFTNGEVAGSSTWHTRVVNSPDETAEPITGLGVKLSSKLEFDMVNPSTVKQGPPIYEWAFGELSEGPSTSWSPDATVGFYSVDQSPITFVPGFDASRSVDKTTFSIPEMQTLTITMVPRGEPQKLKGLELVVHNPNNEFVDAVILPVPDNRVERIEISPDGSKLAVREIPLEINTPWTISVIIQVTPGVAEVEYMPHVGFIWHGTSTDASTGTESGSFCALNNEAGDWTISAVGKYDWDWVTSRNYSVFFHPRIEPEETNEGAAPAPIKIPAPKPEPSHNLNWQIIIGIVAGVVIIALAIFIFIRVKIKRARQH